LLTFTLIKGTSKNSHFNKLNANGYITNQLLPFVLSLSKHERKQLLEVTLSRVRRAGRFLAAALAGRDGVCNPVAYVCGSQQGLNVTDGAASSYAPTYAATPCIRILLPLASTSKPHSRDLMVAGVLTPGMRERRFRRVATVCPSCRFPVVKTPG
jgi:hypothetical protein